MASGTATITAPIGAGRTVTALAIVNVTQVNVDLESEVIQVRGITAAGEPTLDEFEFSTIATVTWTISGETSTIAFST